MRISLRSLARDDLDLVLAWWGIAEVRKFTSTVAQPAYEDLASDLFSRGRRDFMVIHQGRRIGRTCLIDHGDFEEVSVYIAELGLQGRGFGSEAVRETLKESRRSVKCRIRDDNDQSKIMFSRLGFGYDAPDKLQGYSWYRLSEPES